ncbi:hypothetical protein RGQ29_019818 [Quercus rubra]|uniref:Uncharacterized protein n=1 Tax=Quercus rubra TaxID=3512 RepID=A0AAN7FB68_QUERU|nr:hypothetical protein RGQ29_019818 [Quercus rubra]
MANQDEDTVDLDFARVKKLFHYLETLNTQTREKIMHLQSLQNNIEDFEESLSGIFVLEMMKVSTLQDYAVMQQGSGSLIRMKALGEMMGSYSSQDQDDKLEQEVKRLEQALGITIAAASTSGVTFKKEEGGEALAGASISGVTFKKEEGGEASDIEEQKLSKFEGLKKGLDSRKKSLMEYIKECNESDKELGVMNALKVQAVKVGIEVSRLIVDFVFMMLGQEQWAEKIGFFKSSLKGCCIEDENSMVIKKILYLLEMAKIDEPIKGKWARMEQTELDESNQKESLNRKKHIDDQFDEFLDQALGLLSRQFIELTLNLESFMSHPLLPKSEDLMNVVLTEFKCRLEQSEEKPKGIGEDINKLKAMFSSKVDRKDKKMTEARIFVESMIANCGINQNLHRRWSERFEAQFSYSCSVESSHAKVKKVQRLNNDRLDINFCSV